LWTDALRHGIERDFGAAGVNKLRTAKLHFIYFGDQSNAYLRRRGYAYDEAKDLADRKACLARLKSYATGDFLDAVGKRNYRRLDGRAAMLEALADVFSDPLHLLRLSDRLIGIVAPDIREYWNPDTQYGSAVRWPLTQKLASALGRGEEVMLISHSLGTMIAYDALWKLSYYGEYRALRRKNPRRVTWLTLGSPLADGTVRSKLKGASADGTRRFPTLVKAWHNVAAEDDYIAHDQTVADDYADMHTAKLVDSITDYRIFNLAVRGGKANPHHGVGYVIHPVVTKLVYEWVHPFGLRARATQAG
jgi:hypothetical protein